MKSDKNKRLASLAPENFSFDGIDIDSLGPANVKEATQFSFGSSNLLELPASIYELEDDTQNGPKLNFDQAYDEGINLNAFLEDPQQSIVDLNWLMYPNVQESPTEVAHIRDELHRQWIEHKPYKRLDYTEHTPQKAAPCLPKVSLREILQKAVRMISEGIPEPVVLEYLQPISDLDPVQKTLRIINDEKDLLGKLYIRASIYPDCHKGKWKDNIKSINSSARYIISANKCRGCYKNRGGRCDVFMKQIVDLLPWEGALMWYEPLFAERGIEATGNTAQEKVISLFKASPIAPEAQKSFYPVESLPPVELEDALDEIATYKDKRRIIDISYRSEMKEYQNAVFYLDGLKQSRMITPEEYEDILSSSESPVIMMLKARDAVLRAKEVGLYSGPGYEALLYQFGDHTEEEMLDYLSKMDNTQIVLDTSHRIIEENKRRSVDQIKKWVKVKMLSPEQAKAILALDLSPTETILLGKNTILTKGETPIYSGQGVDMIQDHASLIPLDQAWRDLANFKNTQQVIDLSYRDKEKESKEILDNLQRWKKTGLLSKLACDFLAENIGKRPKHEIFAKAAEVITKNVTRARAYKGVGENANLRKIASSQEVVEELAHLERESKKAEALLVKAVSDRKRKGLLEYISNVKSRGVLKTASADKLTSLVKITSDLKKAFELVVSLVKLEMDRKPEMKEIEKRDYDGEGVDALPQMELSIEDALHNIEYADDRPIYSKSEIEQAHLSLVDLMNKGLSQSSLADELQSLGLTEIIDNTEPLYSYLQKYQGVVGLVVLDPEPYFTRGLEGCISGSKVFKRSPVKSLLSRSKCSRCIQNKGGFCNIYGRNILPKSEVDNFDRKSDRESRAIASEYTAELHPSLKNDWNNFLKPND